MKKILLGILVLLCVPSLAFAQEKATLYFSAAGTAYSVGQKINVSITADPKGLTIDTVKALASFSKDILEVQSVTLNSVFSVADPESFYNNADGTISYAAGVPGGISKVSPFATVVFLVKKAGNATITFVPGSIILSGGDNVLSGAGPSMEFTTTAPTIEEPKPEPAKPPVAKPEVTVKSALPPKKQTAPAPVQPKIEENNDTVNTAALSEGAIPIVSSVTSESFLAYLGKNKFNALLWLALLIAVALLVYYRRRILAVFSLASVEKKNDVPNQISNTHEIQQN